MATCSSLSGRLEISDLQRTSTLGVYNSVIIHSDTRVPYGVNGSTSAAVTGVRRSFVAGAQAAVVGFGQDNGPNRITWDEKTFDLTHSNDNNPVIVAAA